MRRAGADKLWVATVMPGYDDTRTTRADKFARQREDGNFYRSAWNAAIKIAVLARRQLHAKRLVETRAPRGRG